MSYEEVLSVVRFVEKKRDVVFDRNEIDMILQHTYDKATLLNKCSDYLPILFENELIDSIMRERLNLRGVINQCAMKTAM